MCEVEARGASNVEVSMTKSSVNMLSGSILKGLLTISIPIMVMNVLQSMFNIIDMSVLKMYDTAGGGLAVGAVGTCSTLISLITGLVIGVSAGANVVTARYIGMKDKEGVERAVGAGILFALCSGIAVSIIGITFAEVFLGIVNCPDKLIGQSALYFRMYFAGVPINMVYNFCASLLRSAGDSKRPMMYLSIGGVLKVAFNFLFVAVFNLGVVGVAISTIISWSFCGFMGVRALLRGAGLVVLKPKRMRFYKRELTDILKIGVPSGLQQALYSIANVIISATVNTYGPEATTGISIANNFDSILYQISMSPALAVMPYVSQNIGANNMKRAKRAIWTGMLITVTLGATFGACSAIFSEQLASIMATDPVIIAYAQQKMIIISSTYFICGINEIMGASLKGMGKPIIPAVATLVFMCLIRFVWVYGAFPLWQAYGVDSFDLTFLYLIWPLGWTLSLTTLLIFLVPTVKKLTRRCDAAKSV